MNQRVLNDTKLAYADKWMKDASTAAGVRSLNYEAVETVTPGEAEVIMSEACPDGYNDFHADLFRLFPADAKITLAREGSVCIYVSASKLPTIASLGCSEFMERGNAVRISWD